MTKTLADVQPGDEVAIVRHPDGRLAIERLADVPGDAVEVLLWNPIARIHERHVFELPLDSAAFAAAVRAAKEQA